MQNKGYKRLFFKHRLRRSGWLFLALLTVVGIGAPQLHSLVQAATCTTISSCQQQINDETNAVQSLKGDASNYQDAISKLGAQVSSLNQQISINQTEQARLQAAIADAETQLAQQRQILGTDIKMQYVTGDISTAEMLASSENLSAFADSETYRSAVQLKIQGTLDQITKLEKDLKDQQADVADLLATQQTQAGEAASARSEQQHLLSYNQSQQTAFNAQAAQNQQKLNALIAAQRAANNSSAGGYYFIRFSGAGKHDPISGSYPYANSGFSMSTAPGCVNNDGPDPWGYCTRQCVSYAAWAVQYSGGRAPVLWGNAKNWVSAARRAGVPVYSTPQPGDIAISTSGTWGHAMYVESVQGNQIYVSQYNQQLNGKFSTQLRRWE